MRACLGIAIALSVVLIPVDGDAAGPAGASSLKSKTGARVTVTTTTLTAPLFLGDEEDETPAGTAIYCTVTVTKSSCFGTSSATCTTLCVYAYGLDASDGTVVSLEPFEDDESLFGSATVSGGRVVFSLSTCRGDEIPLFSEGDEIEVEEGYASGYFGPPVTTCTTSR